MNTTAQVLPYVQLVLAILLILAIIFQRSGAGMEGALGGTESNITHFARRGGEKVLFFATIVIAVLFAASAVVSILMS